MTDFPRTADDITPSWLTDRFKSSGQLTSGSVIDVSVHGQPKADRTASNLAIQYSKDATGTLPDRAFYKYGTNGRNNVEVRRHCAAVREALFYTEISEPVASRIGPRCYDAGGNFDDGEVYLILEDISESHILLDKADVSSPYGGWACFESVTADQFSAVAATLAGFQAQWWDHPRIGEPDLSSGTGDMLSTVMTASDTFVEKTLTREWEQSVVERLTRYGEPEPEAAMALMREVTSAWPRLYDERISRGNLTLMHCDLHLRNVLFAADGSNEPLVIDWEGLTRGIGIVDIAHLLASSMLSAGYLARLDEAIVTAYHEALVDGGVQSYTLEDCYNDYRLAWVALIPQGWDGNPFTRAVLHQFRKLDCGQLIA